ncbi:MAG: SAM-dependent methyltransferase [Elusimicrobiota bacterium]|nr:SAM-dependent methyltransferase [Elusimicrobiota bacterium]
MRKKTGTGQLFICGLGVNRVKDMTLQTLKALRSCDAVYYMHGDWRAVRELLRPLALKLKCFEDEKFYALPNSERVETAGREICGELEKGKTIGYVTYGNPMLLSDGSSILGYCREKGHRGLVITAPSSIDSILGLMTDQYEIFSRGFHVYHAEMIIGRPESLTTAATVIALCVDDCIARKTFAGFCAQVEAAYPANHRIYAVRCEDGASGNAVLTTTAGGLRKMESRISYMMSLVLPCIEPAARGLTPKRRRQLFKGR